MRQATTHKKTKKQINHLDRRLREGIFILLCSLAIYFFIALLTYSEADAAWSHSGVSHQVQNAAGKAGAWVSDILFFTFGLLAYFFPLLFLLTGLWIYRGAPFVGWIRLTGGVLILISTSSLASLLKITANGGGWLGSVVQSIMVSYINALGAFILLFSLLLVSITLLTGFSWLKNAGKIKEKTTEKIKKIMLNQGALTRTKITPSPLLCLPFDEKEEKEEKDFLSTLLVRKQEKKPEKKKEKKHENVFMKTIPSIPSLGLLETGEKSDQGYSTVQLQELSRLVESRLQEFGIEAKVVGVQPGPVITRFELDLAAGIKVSKITTLVKDLARSLSVVSVRVVEVIPGKSFVGLEIPNAHRERVRLKEILQDPAYQQVDFPLSLALGKDIAGQAVVVDLSKMPHLLVAGTTGSGKSVGLNAMLLSILYKSTPLDVRLILIDPKQLELAVYDHIPHLLTPVVTDMKEAANALRWCVAEMERRYQLMAALGVRNLVGYNQKIEDAAKRNAPILDPFWHAKKSEKPEQLEKLPFIVVVVDEFADMMMVVGKKVEDLITRIAQKARAAGIHLVLATQRPSVDVITGLIKANIPTRIAFQVSSRIDSRTILDQSGAEQLLGYGDMLYLPPGAGIPHRIHGAFVGDDEVHKVAEDLRKLGNPTYVENIVQSVESPLFTDGEEDALYDQAVMVVTAARKASASLVQRRLKIGYNRAARLIEQMETQGVISAVQSNGMREVLAPPPVQE